MSITLTQSNPHTPPVTVAVSGLPAVASPAVCTAVVQRSHDGGISWRTVRGLAEAVPAAGAVSAADWEYRGNVVNTYRAGVNQQYVDSFTRTVVGGWGTADTGQVWTTAGTGSTAAVNSGVGKVTQTTDGDMFTALLPDVGVTDVDMGITVDTNLTGSGPTTEGILLQLMARWDGSYGYCAGVHIYDGTLGVWTSVEYQGSGQEDVTAINGTYGGGSFRIRVKINGHRIRVRVWDHNAIPEPSEWHTDITVPEGVGRRSSGQLGIRCQRDSGNADSGLVWSLDDFTVDTGTPSWIFTGTTITPGLTSLWLCSTARSFLNQAPHVVDYQNVSRDQRGGANYVSGRTLPIGLSELGTGRKWQMTCRVTGPDAFDVLDFLAASGDVFFVQVPPGHPLPSGYYAIGRMVGSRPNKNGAVAYVTLPLEERAAPGPDVVTATATWATVLASYGTWAAVVAAHPSGWDSVLELIGDPSEVVVDE